MSVGRRCGKERLCLSTHVLRMPSYGLIGPGLVVLFDGELEGGKSHVGVSFSLLLSVVFLS